MNTTAIIAFLKKLSKVLKVLLAVATGAAAASLTGSSEICDALDSTCRFFGM